MNEIEKAEFNQSLKAYLIPTLLFLATLITAAGMFIIYSGNSAGWPFVAVGSAILIWSFWAFITFHNRLRAAGRYHDIDTVGRRPRQAHADDSDSEQAPAANESQEALR